MPKKNKIATEAIERPVKPQNTNLVSTTKEPQNLVRMAYTAYEGNVKHEPYNVRLKSGVYFKTVNLVKDIKGVWPDAVISDIKDNNVYTIYNENNDVLDYIVEIIKKS